MTLGSASSGGLVRDALSGRTKVAIVTGGSSGIGLEIRPPPIYLFEGLGINSLVLLQAF